MKIPTQADGTLFDLLQQRFPDTSKTNLRQMLRHGRVTVDGFNVRRGDHMLRAGQMVEISAGNEDKIRPPGPILFRDAYLIAAGKPPGVLSVARDRPGEETFYRQLNHFVQETSGQRERIYIVHRLDREASGIMLFALNRGIRDKLQENWATTEKRYWALVEGHPPNDKGTIRGWLQENEAHRVYSAPEGPEAKLAITHYRLRRTGPTRSLLEVRLETGRKSQIRVHLSDLGCPIVGDRKHGARSDPIRRLGLHAFFLAFDHPVTGRRIRLRVPMPGAFRIG